MHKTSLCPASSGPLVGGMTNSQLHTESSSDKPTPKQMRLLRQLADERGASFAYPSTGTEAGQEIKRLLAMPRSRRADRGRELRELRADLKAGSGDAARVRTEELRGYGSSAAWRGA